MSAQIHYMPDVIAWAFSCAAALWLWARARRMADRRLRTLAYTGLAFCIAATAAAVAVRPLRIANHLPHLAIVWGRALGIAAALLLFYVAAWLILLTAVSPLVRPDRRRLLGRTAAVVAAAPAVLLPIAVLRRDDIALVEADVPVPGLPPDLDGLRIVQLSDIHIGVFLDRKTLARAVDIANSVRAHLAVVTGDLISYRGDPLDAALAELRRLRSDSGILGCHGNHEVYAECQEYTTRAGARLGIDFLRHEARMLYFGAARLNVAGVDYQRKRDPYLRGAGALIAPGAFNLLLSHNPDVFPVAERTGFDLMLSGHTHGGQVNIEIVDQSINVARFFTPFVYGLYRRGNASAFVTRGIGTIGLPARVGAPPEVALIRLCAT